MLVREVLEVVAMQEAAAAGRPLLAGTRPGFLGGQGVNEAESEKFWKAMGFERYLVDY